MPELLPLVARWAHILGAVALLGGGLAIVVAFVPTLGDLKSDEEKSKMRTAYLKRWKPVGHSAIFLLLASGLYNYLQVTRPLHDGQPLYHALVGTKMLLAFVVFGLVIVATSTGKAFQSMRAYAPALGKTAVILGIAIVLISGFVGRLG